MMNYIKINSLFKVLLVVAGYDNSIGMLSSTEIQFTRTSPWRTVSPFPVATYKVEAHTLNNIVYVSGFKHSKLMI